MNNLLLQAGGQPIPGTAVAVGVIAAVALVVWLVSKKTARIDAKTALEIPTADAAAAYASYPALVGLGKGWGVGCVELQNISDEDAAMVMAIVSHQSHIPLNQLYFRSIRLLDQ
jgi:hypothetical protein